MSFSLPLDLNMRSCYTAHQHERSRSGHADRTYLSTQGSRPADPNAPESGTAGSRTGLEILPRASSKRAGRPDPFAGPRRLAARNERWAGYAAQPLAPDGLP